VEAFTALLEPALCLKVTFIVKARLPKENFMNKRSRYPLVAGMSELRRTQNPEAHGEWTAIGDPMEIAFQVISEC
jgi:hypothetical protein